MYKCENCNKLMRTIKDIRRRLKNCAESNKRLIESQKKSQAKKLLKVLQKANVISEGEANRILQDYKYDLQEKSQRGN